MRRKGITMKTIKNTRIIGIDHGYGNMKTANHRFKTGISAYDSEPLFTAAGIISLARGTRSLHWTKSRTRTIMC